MQSGKKVSPSDNKQSTPLKYFFGLDIFLKLTFLGGSVIFRSALNPFFEIIRSIKLFGSN